MWYIPVSIGFVFQLFFGLLLTFLLVDLSPSFLDLLTYPVLVLIIFMISITVFLKTKDLKKSFLSGGLLYLLLAGFLGFTYSTNSQYTTLTLNSEVVTVFHPTMFGLDGLRPQIALLAMGIHTLILFITLYFIYKSQKLQGNLSSSTQKFINSKYGPIIQKVLQDANLSTNLSEDLKKELESHFYEKEHDLRFSGLRDEEVENQLSKDFGDEKLVAANLMLVHKFSFFSFIKMYMKKIIVILSILLLGFLFWSPWMGDDGGENVIRKLQTAPELQQKIMQLAEKNGGRLSCEGISSTWAPFGRKVNACGGGWYVTFWGQYFYIDGE